MKENLFKLTKRSAKLLLLRAVLGNIAALILFQSLKYISIGLNTLLLSLAPIVVVLSAACFLGERVWWLDYVSVVGAFIGVSLIVDISVDNPDYLFGVILALSAAIMTGFHYIIIRKLNMIPNLPQIVQSFYFFAVGIVMTFAAHCVAPVLNFSLIDWTDVLIIIGIVLSSFAQ